MSIEVRPGMLVPPVPLDEAVVIVLAVDSPPPPLPLPPLLPHAPSTNATADAQAKATVRKIMN